VDCVQRYNTDVAVIGAAGISARRGVTDLNDQEAGVIRAALEKTERIIVLADGSKFGDVALSTVVPIGRVDTIVTDSSADPAEVDRISREGVEVILAESGSPVPPAADGASASPAQDAPLAVGQ
jgi:DeoR family transcriptional regulator, aga operon transcriptional repressor